MEAVAHLALDLLLPDAPDERDRCVQLLIQRLSSHRGVSSAHTEKRDGETTLCLHYDRDLLTLEEIRQLARSAGAEITGRYRHEVLRVAGMDCGDCAASIQHVIGRHDGVVAVDVSYAAEKMRVEYDTERTSHGAIVRQVRALGYQVVQPGEGGWLREHWQLLLAGAAGVFLAAGFFGGRFLGLVPAAALVLYALAYAAGGFDAARHGVAALLRLRFEIDFLMVVAAAGAAAAGDWSAGALLLFLFSLGHALERYAMGRARASIAALQELAPRVARVRRRGEEREVPVEELERGDRVLVRPGERISVDGTVVEGRSAVDQAPITGESMPVDKEPGAHVFAGSLNGDGALAVEVTRLAQESTLARVIRMVEEAQTKKSPTQRFAERFERIFVPASLGLVALMVAVPPLARLLPFREAFLRAMTVLVAASPCALAIATPSAVLAGIARGGRSGVLIKGGAELEALGRVRAVALDKTGTLTTGSPEITALLPWGKHEEQELLAVCAAAEELSAHPLAQAVVRYARSRGLALPAAQGLHSVTGRGVRAVVAGAAVEVGNLRLFDPPPDLARQVAALEQAGNSTMLVRRNADYLGVIALADRPRREARTMVRQMRDLGVSSVLLLTGDNRLVARAVAAEVGVTEVEAELLPEDKVEAVRRAAARWGAVAMVGDGVNDAPAMAAAAVGIAMGAGGTAAALESADVALMADEVARIPFALALGRRAGGIICQNLFLSLGVIAALVPLALLGLAGIALAIALHEGSTLLVVGNALRLLGFSAHRPPPGRRS